MTFGEKWRYVRKEILRLTQREQADALKVQQSAITAIESGRNQSASFELFARLVLTFGVNPMYFIAEKGEPVMLNGSREKSMLQKITRYEKLISELVKAKDS